MDSLSQIVLGGAIAAAIAPPGHRRAALLAGAALGTLPDLDVIPVGLFADDAVERMTWHRSASHSLLVLPVVAWMIWAWFRSRGGRVAQAPTRWWWAILLALLTHPLLDAFTVYGTQLLWPLPLRPAMWSSVFIIDPLYTVWLALACGVAWWARERVVAQRALVAGLVLSTAYLGWSLLAKGMVERDAEAALATRGLADAPRFSVPMPFTTRHWRVVAMTPDGHLEGTRKLGDAGPMAFRFHPSDTAALRDVRDVPAVQRLAWFNHGFMDARVDGDALVLSDLRMGFGNDYTFRFIVARRDGERWQAVPPRKPGFTMAEAAGLLWKRWREGGDALPAAAAQRRAADQAAAGNSGAAPATSASK